MNLTERTYLARVAKSRHGLNDHIQGWRDDREVRERLVRRGFLSVHQSRVTYCTITTKGRQALRNWTTHRQAPAVKIEHDHNKRVALHTEDGTRLEVLYNGWKNEGTIFVGVGRATDTDADDRVIEISPHDFLEVARIIQRVVEPQEEMRDALVEAHAAAEQLSKMRDRIGALLELESDDD